MIWFDRTQRSVVAGCRSCGARDVFNHQAEADAWARAHVDRAHPSHESGELEAAGRALAITASRVRRHRTI